MNRDLSEILRAQYELYADSMAILIVGKLYNDTLAIIKGIEKPYTNMAFFGAIDMPSAENDFEFDEAIANIMNGIRMNMLEDLEWSLPKVFIKCCRDNAEFHPEFLKNLIDGAKDDILKMGHFISLRPVNVSKLSEQFSPEKITGKQYILILYCYS